MKLTDELLEQAAAEAAERWLAALPEPEEEAEHAFSRGFERDMERLLRPRRRRLPRRLTLLAAVMALLAALGSGVYAGRMEDYRVRATARDGMLVCSARPREDLVDQPFHRITPGWVPEGYTLWSEHDAGEQTAYSTMTYRTEDYQSFRLRQWMGREYSETLLGAYQWEAVSVQGSQGIFITSAGDGPASCSLLWTEGPYVLHLSAGEGMDRETILKIAEHMEW